MRLIQITGVLFAALLANVALAEETAQPSITTATYDAWTVRCASVSQNQDAGKASKLCELVQTAKLRQTGQNILETALGKLNDDESFRLVLKVPNAVFLRDPVVLIIEDGDDAALVIEASYMRCNAHACVADAEIEDDVLNRLITASSVMVSFTGMDQNPIRVPLTMIGLASAFTATFVPQN